MNKRIRTGKNLECLICKKSVYVKLSYVTKFKTCSRECRARYDSLRFSGEGNPAFGKVYRTKETHPEWASKISRTSTDRQINVGDKNGMKNEEVRARQSKTRRERVTSNPDYRKHISQVMCKAWADGKYDGVRVGQCTWHEHTKSDGTIIKLQGTWELAYAKWLDQKQIAYETHVGRISYIDNEGTTRSYYPDFRLLESGHYIDVKNPYYVMLHTEKLDQVRKANPDMTLIVLGKEELIRMGVL